MDYTLQSPAKKLMHKDFVLVVLGQIISLFGNAILRFAMPLYILDQSGSPALFGAVSALSFLPMVIMSPIGGILADRVNKQRIMVVLDFITAGIALLFLLLNGIVAITPLVVVTLMLLFAIQGAYSPAVQASMPLLAEGESLMSANAVINLVQSLSSLLGPILGGILYSAYGLFPVVAVSCGCFAFSAVMELFIRIPFVRQKSESSVTATVKKDLLESLRFIIKERPVMFKVVVMIFLFNLFFSCMLVIGMPVLVTNYLGLSSQLLGYAQGAMAVGGLIGGLLAGTVGKRMNLRRSYLSLLACGISLLPLCLVIFLGAPVHIIYLVLTGVSGISMAISTLFTVQMLSFVQAETPAHIVGKVVSCLMGISICAQPIGQALFGVLFQQFGGMPWVVVLGGCLCSIGIALYSKKAFKEL